MDPSVSCEPAPAPLNHSPGDFGEHCLRQSPTEKKRAFVEVKLSSGEVPEDHWRGEKNPTNLDTLKTETGRVWFYLNYPLPQHGTAQCQERSSQSMVLLQGKIKVCEWVPSFLNCTKCSERSSFLSPLPWLIQLGSEKRLRQQIESSEGLKGTWILPITLLTLWISLLMSHWGCLAHRSQTSQLSPLVLYTFDPHISPSCSQLLVHIPNSNDRKLWQTASEHLQKFCQNLWVRENQQIWALLLTLENEKEDCQHPGWCFAESRKVI